MTTVVMSKLAAVVVQILLIHMVVVRQCASVYLVVVELDADLGQGRELGHVELVHHTMLPGGHRQSRAERMTRGQMGEQRDRALC